jgi:prevent-host-death family protein
MTTTSISELKARLSAYLDVVRGGDEVLVTDRGRIIARLTPVRGDASEDSRRDALVRDGRVRPASAPLPKNFWHEPHPSDTDGRSLTALLDDRAAGW